VTDLPTRIPLATPNGRLIEPAPDGLASPVVPAPTDRAALTRSFTGGAGWNRTTDSALSVLAKGLVKQLVYSLICPFVPRSASKRRAVQLRLGTLWARHEVVS
jgi:hypothetical protein